MLWKKLKQLFSSPKNDQEKTVADKKESPLVVIETCLTTNYDIDLSVDFKELKIDKTDKDSIEKIAKFFHLFSTDTFSTTLASILIDNIAKEDKEHEEFITNLITHWLVLQKTSNNKKGLSTISQTPVIPPNKVFIHKNDTTQ